MVEVSVIVPVYNSQDYIERTLQSILHQNIISDIEVIIINDGSKDSSGEICKSIAERDKRVVYVEQANHGISYTRNKGIALSNGKYILFCDDDDIFKPNLIASNLKIIEDNNSDVVKFGKITISDNGSKWFSKFLVSEFDPNSGECSKQFLSLLRGELLLCIWDAIYSAQFIKSNVIRFDENILAGEEDRNFNFELISHGAHIRVNPNYYYIHFLRNGENTMSHYSENRMNALQLSINNEKLLFDKMKIANYEFEVELLNYFITFIKELGKAQNMKWSGKRKKIIGFCRLNSIENIKFNDITKSNYRIMKYLTLCVLIKLRMYKFIYRYINR